VRQLPGRGSLENVILHMFVARTGPI
jgi:hypothetical protein